MKMDSSKVHFRLLLVTCVFLICSHFLFCEGGLLGDDLDLGLGELLGGGGGGGRKSNKKKQGGSRSVGLVGSLLGGKNRANSDKEGGGVLENLGLDSILGEAEELLGPIIPRLPLDLDRRPYDHPICYDDEMYDCGPNNWRGVCKSGTKQSPINIREREVVEIKRDVVPANPLAYNKAYSKKRDFYLANNGHSISISVSKNRKTDAELYMADLRLSYYFSFLHFHWGSTIEHGSEHKIDGRVFPMEMHYVHYRDIYENAEIALSQGGDLAASVIAVFFDIGEHNPAFQPIVDAVGKIGKKGTKGYMATKQQITLYDLLPRQDVFYRYEGSLTVPKCTEKVLWIVYPSPIIISVDQMAAFRKVNRNYDAHPMWNNFRPVQPLNSRQVSFFNYTLGVNHQL